MLSRGLVAILAMILALAAPSAARADAYTDAVVRFAADQVPGVTARSCVVEQLADGPDGWCAIRLDLTLRYGTDGMAAVARVRELVAAAARELAGFKAARIDITVVDIWQEQA